MEKAILRVLVIDDEEDTYLLFEQQFRSEIKKKSLEFHYARSAEEALIFLHQPIDPQLVLILSDISMPGMNGLELLKLLKNAYPEITVFMITAYGDHENSKTALELGASEIISKPIDFSYLKELILDFMLNQLKKMDESDG